MSGIEPTTRSQRSGTSNSAYVWFVASVAAASGFLFGFDTAVINGALVFLKVHFGLTSFQTEIAASSLLLGCLVGAGAAGKCSDLFGRRKSLMGAALLFAVSALGSALAVSFVFFACMRGFGGLAIGLASALTPVYISEVAPPESRGRLVSLNQLAIVTGILVAYLSNWQLAGLGSTSWRWMFGVAAFPSVGFLVGLFYIPESPRWLVANNQREAGYAVLEKIAGPHGVQAEMNAIELAISEEGGGAGELFSEQMRPRLLIAIALAVLEQICGINTVLYYGALIFAQQFHGQSMKLAIGVNVVVGLVNLIFTIVAMFFIDRWGRRLLFLVATAGMAISLTVLAASFKLGPGGQYLIFGCILAYIAFFAVGLGPGVWVYIAEIFPTRVRGQATSIATMALWSACLVVTLTFLSIVDSMGLSGAFALYALLSLITFVFIWKWIPETRGKSLEQIQHYWSQR
ncbi:sugar porter family MFS transporter [Edaphobacter modestus]|uniref:SP family arabinose:H+ symporter-like MFS transporter n=1 Tax=Edaphobacter modestus TaxID=388466 RepID=A0A4Q7YUX3_9BACT|nr:sugar porter family MFS transporter [Edaphobacter modestus]RZU40795.1 SP family arabinose:H+ symporter-like MFS transporter [Edaphobacter modestus]